MAFEFKKKESVRQGVKRVTRRRVEKALRSLEHCERLEAVHQVRKVIKQLRALLRLVGTAVRRADHCRAMGTLRQAAGLLAAARDAHVKLNALVELQSRFKPELSAQSFREIKRLLTADCRKEQAALAQNQAPRKVNRLLKRFSKDLARARPKKSGWAALAPGLQRSYGDGRRAYKLALEQGTPESFHEWRKRVKDLLYQLRLLCPIWPEQMAAAQAELKRLGEYLGDDHDLFLLTEPDLLKRCRGRNEEEAEALKALVSSRQSELRDQALALGARFYEERPAVFCKRLGQYWKRWRREPKRLTRALYTAAPAATPGKRSI